MKKPTAFDFWYAVNNTEIVVLPSARLETFGATILHYHIVSELMDTVNETRVREGRLQAMQPKIMTPRAYARVLTEGFSEQAAEYIAWLREHEQDVRILQYGYALKQESFSEQLVHDNVRNVVERVKKDVAAKEDPLSAVVIGVDVPWDVCLVKLFWEVIRGSAHANMRDLDRRHLFDLQDGLPKAVRDEIDGAFLAASRNRSLIATLARRLHEEGVFDQYQDRFFSLVKASRHR